MRRFITDRDETSEKYYKLWYVKPEQTLARSIATDIFIRVRFKQRSCMARYVDEKKNRAMIVREFALARCARL